MLFCIRILVIFMVAMLSTHVYASGEEYKFDDAYRDQARLIVDEMWTRSLDILRSPSSRYEDKFQELSDHLMSYMDVRYITGLLLRGKFLRLTPGQRSELLSLFTRFITGLYKKGFHVVIDSDGDFSIMPNVTTRNNWCIVGSYVVLPDNFSVKVTWFTYINSKGEIKIFDVNMSGTGSILMLIKDEVDSVLRDNNGNVNALIAKLRVMLGVVSVSDRKSKFGGNGKPKKLSKSK